MKTTLAIKKTENLCKKSSALYKDEQYYILFIENIRRIFMINDFSYNYNDCALLSEKSLAEYWNNPKEDQAWLNL